MVIPLAYCLLVGFSASAGCDVLQRPLVIVVDDVARPSDIIARVVVVVVATAANRMFYSVFCSYTTRVYTIYCISKQLC